MIRVLNSILTVLVAASLASAEKRAMVVHLPEAPIESMSRLAEGVTALGSYIQGGVPDLTLEVKAFRKSDDAREFIASQGDSVAVVLCDAAFLLDLPDGFEVSHRFVRGGQVVRPKIVVVKGDSGLASLADLRGRSLTVTLSASAAASKFLTETIFNSEIDSGRWFGSIAHETDDFTAIAAVLYGRTDAALVAEDNPLLASHLGKDLTSIYKSGAVPSSVVAVRPRAFAEGQLAALSAGLDGLVSRPEADSIRSVLAIDGFRRMEEGSRRVVDLLEGSTVRRELEVAMPLPTPASGGSLPALSPTAIPFIVGVELREVVIPPELLDSGLKGSKEKSEPPRKTGREP